MNKRNKIIISITGITIVLLALLGITYAYYLTRIQGNTNTNSISVTTANLKLVYDDGNEELDFTNIMPGWINDGLNDNPEPKTFSVTNNGNASVNEYAVSLEEVTNTLTRTEDLTYTLKCTQKNSSGSVIGTCNGNSEEYPKVNQMIITNSIEVGYTHEYELIVNYINHETINQSIDMGSTIKGKVQIYGLTDTVDMTGIVSNYTEDDFVEINSEPKTSRIINNKYTLVGIKPGIHTIKVCSKEDELCNNPKVTKKISIEKGNEVEVGEKIVNNETIPSITVTEDTRTINVNVDVSTTSIIPSTTTSTYNPFESNTLAYNIYQNKALVEEYDASGNSLGTKINKEVKSLPVVTGVSDGTNIEDSGLFMAEDDYGTSYFYRGTVRNNYVDFAGFTWRIVRINGDNSVRLILNGSLDEITKDEETYPVYQNERLNVLDSNGKIYFNLNSSDNANIGYMYGEFENNSTSYNDAHENINNSIIKVYIDTFYEEYLLEYQNDFISDGLFCANKVPGKNYIQKGYSNLETYYTDYDYTKKSILTPTLKCAEQNENFTEEELAYSRYTSLIDESTKTKKGVLVNNDLTYPIALLNIREATMMGQYKQNGGSDYLTEEVYQNGWWLMTPGSFSTHDDSSRTYMFLSDGKYFFSRSVANTAKVRPVINIKSEVIVNSGDGTESNPYVIE